MRVFEIPLSPSPKRFSIPLSGTTYQFVLMWRAAQDGGWMLDINDDRGRPMICGIPLVTGVNLLAQHPHFGFDGELWVVTDGDPTAPPTFTNLGIAAHLYWVTP